MLQLNRRKFLYSGVALSATAALGPHILAMSSEGAWQPGNSVSQEACTGPSVQPQFGGDCNFINWRQQGLSLGEKAVHNRQYTR
jgi:hypothetical protein